MPRAWRGLLLLLHCDQSAEQQCREVEAADAASMARLVRDVCVRLDHQAERTWLCTAVDFSVYVNLTAAVQYSEDVVNMYGEQRAHHCRHSTPQPQGL